MTHDQDRSSESYVPNDLLGRFNWGAFFLTWIWGLYHRAYFTLALLLIDIVNVTAGFGVARRSLGASAAWHANNAQTTLIFTLIMLGLKIWLGVKGYELAWESRRYRNGSDCRRSQAIWGWCGLAYAVVLLYFVAVAAYMAMPSTPR